jgi:DNA-binding HxlR family transcriptional regulator
LAIRLKELQKIGVLERKSYNETPPRVEYNLTDRGQELVESIVNLLQWMRKWNSAKYV